ncbi:MAG: FHA domain-containing protein [Planctomycetota bacterium]|nr:FHA domain-containing protein [Planctomycetota bacterium]
MMAKLTITDNSGKERIHELVDDVTTIGRASSNIIQVADEKASRQHFRVEKAGERFRLVDLGSTNGTRLNGVKLQGQVLLRPGDKLSVGKTVFLFEDPNAPVMPPPPPPPQEAQAPAPSAPEVHPEGAGRR